MKVIDEESTNMIEVTNPAGESFILFYIFYSLVYIQILKQTLINFRVVLRSLVGFHINNVMLFLISFKGGFHVVMPLEISTTGVILSGDIPSCMYPFIYPIYHSHFTFILLYLHSFVIVWLSP